MKTGTRVGGGYLSADSDPAADFEAMLSTLVLFLMFMRVYSGMKRCRPAQSKKMTSKTMKTTRILFAMAGAVLLVGLVTVGVLLFNAMDVVKDRDLK